MKFILLINVKIPTIVGILTFITMINTYESLKARKSCSKKFKCSLELSMKKSAITSGHGCLMNYSPMDKGKVCEMTLKTRGY